MIINALSYTCVAINGIASWTALLRLRQFKWKEKKRTRYANTLIIKICHGNLVIFQKLNCTSCSENSTYLFNFIRFSMRRYTHCKRVNWCTMLHVAMEKVLLIFLHLMWLGPEVMCTYHLNFNLAFQMKCKYCLQVHFHPSCLFCLVLNFILI